MALDLTSTLTCPNCAAETTGEMPTDSCQFFWECPACHEVIRPKAGDCCVYCSFGTTPCPPVQENGACCG